MVAELRDYLNLCYKGEATVATEIGLESSSLADWLVGESSTQPSITRENERFFLEITAPGLGRLR
jgi:hypothetical protein